MSLQEKLAALRSQEVKKEEIERARVEKARRILEREKEKARRLMEIANERLRPALELVNKIYLENRGVIGVRIGNRIPSSSSLSSEELYLKELEHFSSANVFLDLKWDGWSEGITFWRKGGKRLKMSLNRAQSVELVGAGKESPRIELDLNDKSFQQKLEEGIYSILTTPNACKWWATGVDGSR